MILVLVPSGPAAAGPNAAIDLRVVVGTGGAGIAGGAKLHHTQGQRRLNLRASGSRVNEGYCGSGRDDQEDPQSPLVIVIGILVSEQDVRQGEVLVEGIEVVAQGIEHGRARPSCDQGVLLVGIEPRLGGVVLQVRFGIDVVGGEKARSLEAGDDDGVGGSKLAAHCGV